MHEILLLNSVNYRHFLQPWSKLWKWVRIVRCGGGGGEGCIGSRQSWSHTRLGYISLPQLPAFLRKETTQTQFLKKYDTVTYRLKDHVNWRRRKIAKLRCPRQINPPPLELRKTAKMGIIYKIILTKLINS